MNHFRKLNFLTLAIPLYLLTRLVNFLILPIFTDEAIYGYWAQIALHDPSNRFASLEDGKQPLFIWLAAIFQRLIADPLVATRLVSVFAGLGSLLGIYFLARELFGAKVAKMAGVLYIILPFTLLYDRLALFDSLLTMFCIWSVFLTIKMAKTPRLDFALLNGITLGLGLITKSSASFFLYLLPASLIIFEFRKNQVVSRLSKWAGLSLLTFAMSEIMYNALRVSPLFYMIDRKNHEFIRTFSEVIKTPFLHFSGNINSMVTWLFQYNGPLILLLPAVMVYGLLKKDKRLILLSGYVLVPFLAEALFNQILYPRFSLFYFPFIIILVAFGISFTLESLSKYKALVWAVLLAAIIFPLVSSFYLLTNPPKAGIADSDKFQYIDSWSSGYGVSEIATFLKEENHGQKIYVGTEGTFGLLPFALQIYFYGNPNIQFVGFWPVGDLPKQVLDSAKTQKTYFIFYQNQNLPQMGDLSRLQLIGKYRKGNGLNFMSFYEVNGN